MSSTMTGVRYRVEHETRYTYKVPVSQSWQLARLTPCVLPWQSVLFSSIRIDPSPDERHDALDSFGNTMTHFALYIAHRSLRVQMRCAVEVRERSQPDAASDAPWSDVRAQVRGRAGEPWADGRLEAALMMVATPLVPYSELARVYAAPSLASGRLWLAALDDLMHRIHADFEFDTHATTVSTSVDEVLLRRRGVCQDFAHLMLACLRAHGLPARYVSGYLLTTPPPGQARLMGADASHAWVAAYAPAHGWVEFDPTNDQRADSRYITLASGADFADVAPLRGVIMGAGEQAMQVSVSVIPE